MKICIVRHGQTDYNVNGRYGGRLDVPLNENGIKEAYKVKEKLENIKFDKIYSSPLKRAYLTAKIIRDENIIKDDKNYTFCNWEEEGFNKQINLLKEYRNKILKKRKRKNK